MIIPHNIFSFIQLLGSKEFIFCVQTSSLFFKFFLIISLSITIRKHKNNLWKYLFVVIAAGIAEDFSWIISLSHKLFFPSFPYTIILFFIRIGWVFNIIMYQALSLFIESFKNRTLKLNWYYYLLITTSSFIFLLLISTFFSGNYSSVSDFELSLRTVESMYALLLLMPITCISAFYSINNKQLPKIIRLQLKTCLNFFLLPHLIANLFQVYPFTFSFNLNQITNNPAAVSISAIFLSLTLYHCVKKIIGLRFLNVHNHVQDEKKFNFVDDFKSTLEQLGNASNISEIKLLTQHFFHKAFGVGLQNVIFIMHSQETKKSTEFYENHHLQTTIENFISFYHVYITKNTFYNQQEIFIYDEIAYNQFHDPQELQHNILTFLQEINADIFLPLYENSTIIGAIIITKNGREKKLYTNIERDEMLVFASYIAKILHLLQNRNLTELLKQKKDILDELYQKHHEISQYKESIRSFMRTQKEKGTGIIFYKNRKFTMGNKLATDMLGINPNTQEGEPLTKKLRSLAFQVDMYRTPNSFMTHNPQGEKVIIIGFPYPEKSGVVITIQNPEVSDTIKELIDGIKDPSNWDYLLYLETTESGRLINKFIPSNGERFLNFKIDLLKLALSKKALFLDLAQDDIMPIIELLHTISLRETLHILELHAPLTSEQAIDLFGINTLFGEEEKSSLLEKLHKTGTLFIKNAHFLDHESQENLAHFIKYGFYHLYKSNKKMQSDVRIILSSEHTLSKLVKTGAFSEKLFNELRKTSLIFPSLQGLHHHELEILIEGFNQQALQGANYNQLLILTEKEKEKILRQHPTSFCEVKKRVENMIISKSKKIEPHKKELKTYTFDPAYHNNDVQLAQAAKLGKEALKNKTIMSHLWSTFKSQNKIATFLGVNRSSVHRRCKDYNLE